MDTNLQSLSRYTVGTKSPFLIAFQYKFPAFPPQAKPRPKFSQTVLSH